MHKGEVVLEGHEVEVDEVVDLLEGVVGEEGAVMRRCLLKISMLISRSIMQKPCRQTNRAY